MWQPIETAPTDGTSVITWNGEYVTEGAFINRRDDDGHTGWCRAEFTRGGILYDLNNVMEPAPTHWMPMPEPPK